MSTPATTTPAKAKAPRAPKAAATPGAPPAPKITELSSGTVKEVVIHATTSQETLAAVEAASRVLDGAKAALGAAKASG